MHKVPTSGRDVFIRYKANAGLGPVQWRVMITARIVWPCANDGSFKFLPSQLSMVGYWPTMVATGDGELGFDSGEGA